MSTKQLIAIAAEGPNADPWARWARCTLEEVGYNVIAWGSYPNPPRLVYPGVCFHLVVTTEFYTVHREGIWFINPDSFPTALRERTTWFLMQLRLSL